MQLDPVPGSQDKIVYWILAAVAGAFAGGVVFNLLRQYDPIK